MRMRQCSLLKCHRGIFCELFTAVTTNTRPRMVFFFWLKPEFSWTSINCFHGFLTCSDREGSLVDE